MKGIDSPDDSAKWKLKLDPHYGQEIMSLATEQNFLFLCLAKFPEVQMKNQQYCNSSEPSRKVTFSGEHICPIKKNISQFLTIFMLTVHKKGLESQ